MSYLREISNEFELPASVAFLERLNRQTIAAYREKPVLIEEHVRQEKAIREGAYSRRQVYELVQNAVDALQDTDNGRTHVLLTNSALYCADNGRGLTNRGLMAILNSYLSPKADQEIGRYGLGFKSVLAVTDRPEFYTTGLAFRFDPDWARHEIRNATGFSGECPVLRLARPLDKANEIERDPHLAALAEWATTIVKLPFSGRFPEWLENDIFEFPAQLLLFAPHVSELVLEDERNLVKRVLTCERGEVYRLSGDRDMAEWRVFDARVRLPEDIRREGGIFSGRESIKISWAVPVRGVSNGKFWAFFPLDNEEMSLKGILNAPWKLNDDRTKILPGNFTTYLLERAVEVVLHNLPVLVDRSDPGKILEMYPAREDERKGTDLALTREFYSQARFAPIVPDTRGELRRVAELNLHPKELTQGAIEEWLRAPQIPTNWAHGSCALNTVRQARIDQLISDGARPRSGLKEWLEVLSGATQPDLATDVRIQRSGHAIRAAAKLMNTATKELAEQIRSARIVLTETFEYVPVDPNQVFLPHPESEADLDLPVVQREIAQQTDTVFALQDLGITEVDASSELRSFIHSRGIHNLTDDDWERVWRIVDRIVSAGVGDAAYVLRELCGEHYSRYDIKVRTVAGTFRRIRDVLLPGRILAADPHGPDRDLVIDEGFHFKHWSVLRDLGAVSEPEVVAEPPTDGWFREYQHFCARLFVENLRRSGITATPRADLLEFDQTELPTSLGLLERLSPAARARMSRSLLRWLEPSKWTMSHKTNPTYPRAEVPSPVKWMLDKYGYLDTSLGPRPLSECVGPGLARFGSLLPVADCSESDARLLELPNDIAALPATIVKQVLQSEIEPSPEVVSFWAAVCENNPPPSALKAKVGTWYQTKAPDEIVVAEGAPEKFVMLERLGVPYVVTPTEAEAERLRRCWKLKAPSSVVETRIEYEPIGEPVPLFNLFPALQLFADPELESLSVVPCRVLELRHYVGRYVEPEQVDAFLDDRQLLLVMDPGEDFDLYNEATLARVLSLLDIRLEPAELEIVRSSLERSAFEQRAQEVAREQDIARKLLVAVGVDVLRSLLSDEILRGTDDDEVAIARRFHSVYGVESLIVLKDALRDAGFHVPGTWAGSFEARRFVRQLGFPEPYAGFSSSERPVSLDVPSRVSLPPLHDFQERLVERILALLDPTTSGPRRGLLSLPTGAGKTRVSVEALVRGINAGLLKGPVLWIAQTEELCEQAVQAWAELWAAQGARGILRINRLWSTREANEYVDGPHVVVATRQKLEVVRGKPEYEWLSEAAMVVVDEAHESITASYTRTLEWLGLDRRHTSCPLLGLSATPFRGGEKETRRLASRYNHNRLDQGLFGDDPYKELQKRGILSQVDHELLEGVTVDMTEKEFEYLEQYDRLPQSTTRQLTLHERRNRQIIESIRSKPANWSILVFALSVDHAKLLAAALAEQGISAAAVSSQTAAGARRYYIEQFKAGEIRVLTNYGVLTTGFDAPKVEAIYVARPVFSPSRYQQMIGRGLRGPLNGGTERCLIVNVADTFERFGRDLAFREFEYLWS